MNKTWLIGVVCSVIASHSSLILAWGQTGHRVTGAIAERHLSRKAKKVWRQLLPNESLAEASTYPDEMRSNPSSFWQKTASPFHYVTAPDGTPYDPHQAPPKGDAVTALQRFTRTLKDKHSSREEKQLALRFIVHIIGDLHQPLHVGNGKDRGGNDVKLSFFREATNLHRVWDHGLIQRQGLSYTEWTRWLDQKIRRQDVKAWSNTDPLVWIQESRQVRNSLYPKTTEISWDYAYQHTPLLKRRLQQGGIRIAAYFNKHLPLVKH